MKAVIVNFTGERPNWGCQATSRELHKFCCDILRPFAPVELSTVPNPPVHILDTVIEKLLGHRIAEIFAAAAPAPDDLRFIEKIVERRFGELVSRVRESDLVIFQGEGTMGPKQHFRGVRFFGLPFLAKQLWKKPVISLNQSFYAARPHELRIARNVYKDFDVIALREGRSYAMCRDIGLAHALLCPDMAFRARCETPLRDARWQDGTYFCVTGSAALEHYNLADYLAIIRDIARTHRLRPVFLYSKQKDAKLPALAANVIGAGNYDTAGNDEYPDYTDILPILRQAKFVIGGRYHTSVMAIAQGTPVILLPGNTYKTEGLGQLLGIELPVVAPQDIQAVHAATADVVANREHYATSIASALPGISHVMQAFGAHLQAVIRHRCLHQPAGPMPAMPQILAPASGLQRGPAVNEDIYRAANVGHTPSPGRLRAGIRTVAKLFRPRNLGAAGQPVRKVKVLLIARYNRSIYDLPQTTIIQPASDATAASTIRG